MANNRTLGFEGGIKVATTKKDMHEEVPRSRRWTKTIKSLRSEKGGHDKRKNEYFYSCTFKVPTDQEQLREYLESTEYAVTLPFEERLNYEMSRAVVSAYVKNGTFVIGDAVPQGRFPQRLMDIFTEMVKVKMLVEYEVYKNDAIRATVPQPDESKIDISVINNEIEALRSQMGEEDSDLDTDAILDKINTYGIGSISDREMEYLNQLSRRL